MGNYHANVMATSSGGLLTLSLLTFTSQSFLSAEDTSMLLSRRNDSMLIQKPQPRAGDRRALP